MDLERMKNWFCQPNEPAALPGCPAVEWQAGRKALTACDCNGFSVRPCVCRPGRRQCSRGVHSALKSIRWHACGEWRTWRRWRVSLSVCLTIGKLFCLGILSLQVKNDSEEERYTVLWTERALTRRINSFVETHNYVQVT